MDLYSHITPPVFTRNSDWAQASRHDKLKASQPMKRPPAKNVRRNRKNEMI